MKAIDLIRKADNYQPVEERFDIPITVNGQVQNLKACLRSVSVQDILKKQDILFDKELVECRDAGLHNIPIHYDEWIKMFIDELSGTLDQKQLDYLKRVTPKELKDKLSLPKDAESKLGDNHNLVCRLYEKLPRNKADFRAKQNSRYDLVVSLIPKYLRDEKGELLFSTPEEQIEFRDYVKENGELTKLLSEKWLSLVNKISDAEETAKNLPEKVEN